MRKPMLRLMRLVSVLFLLFFFQVNCSIFKPKMDPVGLQYAVSIQQEALEVVAKARESFSLHREEVYRLMTRVERAYEHARPLYKNGGVTGIWDVMRDPLSNRLARFMAEWEKEDILDESYIKSALKWVKDDFDILIKIEEKKK